MKANNLFIKKVYTNNEKFGDAVLPYRLYVPQNYDTEIQYPLFIFLHGAGERGDDNEVQISTYNCDPAKMLTGDLREKYPCIIIAPQCPQDKKWVECDWTKVNYNMDKVPLSVPAGMLLDVIDMTCSEFSTDKNRIYISGLSMGGFGTWDLITRFPDKFAAAAPVCGGADPKKADAIKNKPVWTFHGSVDSIVPVQGTREIVEALKKAGSTGIIYNELEGVDHGCWDEVYSRPELYDWIFSKHKQ